MKTSLLLALLVLAGGGSPSAPAADPRIAQIQAQHKQPLALQAPFSETENQILELEKEVKKLPNSGSMELDKGLPQRHRQYAEMVADSEAAMGTLNQLDPAKSQDAATSPGSAVTRPRSASDNCISYSTPDALPVCEPNDCLFAVSSHKAILRLEVSSN